MSRVVEVDKVVNEIARFKGYLDDEMIYRLQLAIKRLPAADAIPVGWIERYCTDIIFSDDYSENAEGYDDSLYAIEGMVRDWKKENEVVK